MKVENKNFILTVSLAPKSKKCQSKDGASVKKPVIVINAKLTCTRTKVENFRKDFQSDKFYSKIEFVFQNSKKWNVGDSNRHQ